MNALLVILWQGTTLIVENFHIAAKEVPAPVPLEILGGMINVVMERLSGGLSPREWTQQHNNIE